MNKRGQETREHIKKCAADLFARKGFKQVTMKDICVAAGLSRGGLYCHYNSTGQIFQEMINDMMSSQDMESDLKIRQNQSAAAILNELLDRYQNEMEDTGASLSLAIYEFFSSQDMAGGNHALYEQYLISVNTWRKLIQYGMERKEFCQVDIDAVIDLIIFSYQGVRMYGRLVPVDKEIPSRIIRQIKSILIRGD